MPECFRLARRVAAEARSPSASPAQCAGYDGAYRASSLPGLWIPATPCPRKARGRARPARRRRTAPGTTRQKHAGMTDPQIKLEFALRQQLIQFQFFQLRLRRHAVLIPAHQRVILIQHRIEFDHVALRRPAALQRLREIPRGQSVL